MRTGPQYSSGHMKPLILSLLLVFASVIPAAAQIWALGGYDVVSYQKSGRPIPGRTDIATMWQGKIWHFATEENRARFEADPRSYAPGFGGLCPVSLAEGTKQKGDPRYFVIIGKRLYLLRSAAAERQLLSAPREVIMQARETLSRMR